MATRRHDAGLGLIVGYKLIKASAAVLFGSILLVLTLAGGAGQLRVIAQHVQHHAAAAWSIALAERLVRAMTERHLVVVAVAVLLDGLVSFVEGWALHRRYRWSGWLVVGATSCLLPFEVIALVHRVTVGRIVLLLLNLLIVFYLVWRRGVR